MSEIKSFSEMPFSVAIKQFPILKSMFPLKLLLHFASDDNYIVRMSDNRLEIGYASDVNWTLGAENV